MKIGLKERKIHSFKSLSSTNDYAQEMLAKGKPTEGTIIISAAQTHGKGTGLNTWESEPGKNLLASIILYPDFLPADKQFLLNKCISLAVLKCIKHFLPDENISIKWPNDLYVGTKKIGGILIQNTISGHYFQNCIVGIGLNINQENFSESLPNPCSIKQLTGMEVTLKKVLETLDIFIHEEYSNLAKGYIDEMNAKYLQNLLNYQKVAKYKAGDELFEGVICGVSEFGKLHVTVGDKTSAFDFKEIVFLFD